MAESGRYTAEDLAARVGLPVRTVRFYLREKLVDPPLGRGRGAHFDERHVAQLLRVRGLRHVGLDLETIRSGAEGMALLKRWEPALEPPQAEAGDPKIPSEDLDLTTAIRIPMAEGVELLVDPERPIPSPRRLVEIALQIRKAFGRT
jgi:DNA-binding transcriptional MerR regulator